MATTSVTKRVIKSASEAFLRNLNQEWTAGQKSVVAFEAYFTPLSFDSYESKSFKSHFLSWGIDVGSATCKVVPGNTVAATFSPNPPVLSIDFLAISSGTPAETDILAVADAITTLIGNIGKTEGKGDSVVFNTLETTGPLFTSNPKFKVYETSVPVGVSADSYDGALVSSSAYGVVTTQAFDNATDNAINGLIAPWSPANPFAHSNLESKDLTSDFQNTYGDITNWRSRGWYEWAYEVRVSEEITFAQLRSEHSSLVNGAAFGTYLKAKVGHTDGTPFNGLVVTSCVPPLYYTVATNIQPPESQYVYAVEQSINDGYIGTEGQCAIEIFDELAKPMTLALMSAYRTHLPYATVATVGTYYREGVAGEGAVGANRYWGTVQTTGTPSHNTYGTYVTSSQFDAAYNFGGPQVVRFTPSANLTARNIQSHIGLLIANIKSLGYYSAAINGSTSTPNRVIVELPVLYYNAQDVVEGVDKNYLGALSAEFYNAFLDCLKGCTNIDFLINYQGVQAQVAPPALAAGTALANTSMAALGPILRDRQIGGL